MAAAMVTGVRIFARCALDTIGARLMTDAPRKTVSERIQSGETILGKKKKLVDRIRRPRNKKGGSNASFIDGTK